MSESSPFQSHLQQRLARIQAEGLLKSERQITSPQDVHVTVNGRRVLNLCANNYLGLANDPRIIAAAAATLSDRGYGMASVRFICGTQDLHRALEQRIATFVGHQDAVLFGSCFDANGGLFEPLLGAEDAIISDALNHASIIDGIRLCKARRFRYDNSDMGQLEDRLKEARAAGSRFILIATDGVFSMDGFLANLTDIRALADRYGAMIMVDDCHATGFIGPQGRGTAAHAGIHADIVTGTLGKALGGAMGGYVAASQPVIDILRQQARPYLFSNALPPSVVAAGLVAFEIVEQADDLRAALNDNARFWREGLETAGFTLLPGQHPIVPVMLGEARMAESLASALFDHGVYVAGFSFPVVPMGMSRIRTQMNARMTRADLEGALSAFVTAGKQTGAIA